MAEGRISREMRPSNEGGNQVKRKNTLTKVKAGVIIRQCCGEFNSKVYVNSAS